MTLALERILPPRVRFRSPLRNCFVLDTPFARVAEGAGGYLKIRREFYREAVDTGGRMSEAISILRFFFLSSLYSFAAWELCYPRSRVSPPSLSRGKNVQLCKSARAKVSQRERLFQRRVFSN